MDSRKRSASNETSSQTSTKKPKNCQKYKKSYTLTFPCVEKSTLSEQMVFCTVCSKHFSIAHGGIDDCRRHVRSVKHTNLATAAAKTKNVLRFFAAKNDETDVVKAESLFVRFLIEHNIPIAAADHAKHLFSAMFPDSNIAKNFCSGRTKTTAIIKNMAKRSVSEIIEILNKGVPFSLSTDGSNDSQDVKLYPLLITYFDEAIGRVTTKLISLVQSSNNTGEGIFQMLNTEMKKKGLQWEKCLSFSADNTNTMMGKKKGVVSHVLKENPSIIVRGCPCHLLHIAAKNATSAFDENLELFIVDIFYFLDKSSKRKSDFKFHQLCHPDVKPHKILKYTSTRWLSLLTSINRVLEQWNPLMTYFSDDENQDNGNKRFKRIRSSLESPIIKLNLLFLSSVLPFFTNVNVLLQQEAPCIHKIRKIIKQLLLDLLVRFIKPKVADDISCDDDLSPKSFSKKKNQKKDEELVIGVKTRMYLSDMKLNEDELSTFYDSVRKFYVKGCSYISEKILKYDEFLEHAEIADPTCRFKKSFSSVMSIIKRFPFIASEDELEKLEMEFARYQADKLETVGEIDRIDAAWSEISKLRDCNGVIKYTVLPKVMMAVLTVPHSNAESERVFSLLRKNQTDFRPNLGTETLEALLIEKINMISSQQACYDKTFTADELKCTKQCTAKAVKNKM